MEGPGGSSNPSTLNGWWNAVAIARYCGGAAPGRNAKRSQGARMPGRSAIGDAGPRRNRNAIER
eukprot:14403919-Alexandrium_andersonii.AAC.1